MNQLVIEIIKTSLQILSQQLGGKPGIVIADALAGIVFQAMSAYEAETGQPIDPDKIKPYEPI